MFDAYLVTWDVVIDGTEADTPEAAARIALEMQRDPNCEATDFRVRGFDRVEGAFQPEWGPEIELEL